MNDNSKIKWTDATWIPVHGCTKISPDCTVSYAESFAEAYLTDAELMDMLEKAYEAGDDRIDRVSSLLLCLEEGDFRPATINAIIAALDALNFSTRQKFLTRVNKLPGVAGLIRAARMGKTKL